MNAGDTWLVRSKVGDLLLFASTDYPVLDSGYELYVVDLSA